MSGHKKAIIIASGIVLLILGAVITRLAVGGSHATCLNGDDYKDLTGVPMLPTTNPASSFYSYNLEFVGNTIGTTGEDKTVNQIATFYKSHRDRSILINISSINQEPTTGVVAKTRVHNLVDRLTAAGVKTEAIRSSDPEFYELDSNSAGTITITLTTSRSCKQ